MTLFKYAIAFMFGVSVGQGGAHAQQVQFTVPQQQTVVIRPYVPPGGSIVQRPMGSDYDATTPYCDPRYANPDDPCVIRRYNDDR